MGLEEARAKTPESAKGRAGSSVVAGVDPVPEPAHALPPLPLRRSRSTTPRVGPSRRCSRSTSGRWWGTRRGSWVGTSSAAATRSRRPSCGSAAEDIGELGREWLFTVTRRICIDVQRKSRMTTIEDTDAVDAFGGAASEAALVGESGAIGSDDELLKALHHLPDRQQEAIRLKFESGLSYAEIASVMETSAGNVGWFTRRSRDSGAGWFRKEARDERAASIGRTTRG